MDKEKNVQRVLNMVFHICGCSQDEAVEVLFEASKRVKNAKKVTDIHICNDEIIQINSKEEIVDKIEKNNEEIIQTIEEINKVNQKFAQDVSNLLKFL